MATTIAACLATINVTLDQLGGDLADEWKLIKKSYFRACLDNHPDKGGDASAFRKVQRAFEALRALFDRGAIASFGDNAASTSVDTAVAGSEAEVPSWEFYADAAEEPVPIYRVEPAKSHRSKCTAKGAAKKCDGCIEKGALRVGYLNIETGTYGSWKNLSCWRVPSKVWLGLPDPDKVSDSNAFKAALISMSSVVLSGAGELEAEDALAFTAHCMDKTTWARLVKRKESTAQAADKHGAADGGQSAPTAPALPPPYSSAGLPVLVGGRVAASSAISVDKRFVIPVPGKDGPANSLAGKTVVLTGVFPEVGGGAGLDLGKARVKAMVEAFGGKVTGSVSGRTDVLIVGKEPGASKVGKAQSSGTCTLMSLLDVRKGLELGSLESASNGKAPMVIQNFSSGFRGNGIGHLIKAPAAPPPPPKSHPPNAALPKLADPAPTPEPPTSIIPDGEGTVEATLPPKTALAKPKAKMKARVKNPTTAKAGEKEATAKKRKASADLWLAVQMTSTAKKPRGPPKQRS